MEMSGLEEEFELARGLPRLLYVKAPAPDREQRLADLLRRIQRRADDSYRTFRTTGELGRLVRDGLATLLSERFAAAAAVSRPAAPRDRSGAPAATRPAGEPRQARPVAARTLPVGTT